MDERIRKLNDDIKETFATLKRLRGERDRLGLELLQEALRGKVPEAPEFEVDFLSEAGGWCQTSPTGRHVISLHWKFDEPRCLLCHVRLFSDEDKKTPEGS